MKRAARITRATLLYLAGWMPAVALFMVVMQGVAWTSSWKIAAYYVFTYLTPAMVLGVPAMMLARWLIDRRLRWSASLAIHAVAAVLFTLLWHGAFFGYLWTLGGIEAVKAGAGIWWPWQLSYGMLAYGVIVGINSTIHSLRRLREREVAAARSDAMRVRAEMQALRGQLDPHFLFNTLHSITALVRSNPPQAEEALVQFGALLRRVLDWKREGTDEVMLAEELAFVDGCLALEQLRLGDRLRVERALAPEALGCYIPVFSVQPLVENAIRHGIAPHRAGGVLTISAEVHADVLKIIIADSGPGAEATQVAAATGTGLSAIRQRLQIRHGDAASLTINTAPGRGFAVTVSLPAIEEPVLNTVA